MERALEEQSLGVRLGRNVWSVTVGFVVMFMLAALAFIVIAFSFPPSYRIPTGQPPPVWITQTYAVTLVLASILGGYITAGMGSRRNLASVFILAFCWFMVSLFVLAWGSQPNGVRSDPNGRQCGARHFGRTSSDLQAYIPAPS